jgi:glycosyltransferase involved in cell wall biosynthesis
LSSSPLRVLFALPGLHRVNRGAEVVLEEVARRAAAEQHLDVTMIGSGPPRDGEPYRYVRARGLKREWFEKFPKIPYLRDHYAYEEFFFAPGLFRKYKPRDYDVTVTCGYPYTNWVLRARRKDQRPRHVFITQNGDWMVQASNWEYKHFSCDGLVCTNPEYYERHKDRYLSALIPNGVDVARFRPGEGDRQRFGLPAGAPVILIVSALIPSKRVLEGVRAAAAVPEAFLLIAGDGEQRHAVDALGRELLGDRFKRVVLSRSDMPGLYRTADVLLHMSQDEPFGNIYIEALASGLPIVAHASTVTRWIVEAYGDLVDTSDGAAVSAALRRTLDKGRTGDTGGRRAFAETRFSWETIAEQYCQFFRRVYGSESFPSSERSQP